MALILVIEDSEADSVFVQRVLRKNNYAVVVAVSGEAGLTVLHNQKVDLIILDYFLPGMNGVEICNILKCNEGTKNIPVIFLTVAEAGQTILECYGAGAETYMHKPIDAKHLLREVKSLLVEANQERSKKIDGE